MNKEDDSKAKCIWCTHKNLVAANEDCPQRAECLAFTEKVKARQSNSQNKTVDNKSPKKLEDKILSTKIFPPLTRNKESLDLTETNITTNQRNYVQPLRLQQQNLYQTSMASTSGKTPAGVTQQRLQPHKESISGKSKEDVQITDISDSDSDEENICWPPKAHHNNSNKLTRSEPAIQAPLLPLDEVLDMAMDYIDQLQRAQTRYEQMKIMISMVRNAYGQQ